ncbi:hypothetical protein M0R45_025006 [Rubus argutus]|uniref:mannose-6-phosphate isomerase n=1 Tax=Rubus argutus TaxID=59490 RepID=A0AAW1WX02_RUBAR
MLKRSKSRSLRGVLDNVPEIVQVVGSEVANQLFDTTYEDEENKLRSIFSRLMSATNDLITTATAKLKNRLHRENQVKRLTEKEQLVSELERQYPDDVGLISACLFFLTMSCLIPQKRYT